MTEKKLGKIEECFITTKSNGGNFWEICFTFTGPQWGCCCHLPLGLSTSVCSGDVARFLSVLEAAQCTDFEQLKGKPVECEFDGQLLVNWRILTEVL